MNLTGYSCTSLICKMHLFEQPMEEDYSNLPRPHYTFAYVRQGVLRCKTASYTVVAEKGDILFIPYQIRYRLYWAEPNSSVFSCHFNFPAYSEPFRNRELPLQKIAGREELIAAFSFIYENIEDKSCLLGVMGTFYSLCQTLYPCLKVEKVCRPDERIRRAVEYIQENFRNNITVKELLDICSMSQSHFHYCFKKETGMTAIEYKNRICINHAFLLLEEYRQLSIEEISAACGFESAEYFRRVFKNITGISPREYRKKAHSL